MTKQGKQLGQLLQEQQEPFVLETYLLERGCLKKSLTSEGGFSCCGGKSSKRLKSINPQCSKMLRDIFDNLLLSITGNPKGKLCDHGEGNSKEVAEQERYSSASSMTVFDSCSGSETEDSIHQPCSSATTTTVQVLKQKKQREEEVQRRSKKHRFGFRPVSVLGGSLVGQSDDAKTRKQQNSSNGVRNGSVSSACLLELLVQSPRKTRDGEVTELQDLIWSNTSTQFFRPKRVLHERKKLLFDCVREMVEAHESRQQSIGEFHGHEELKQLVCQKTRTRGKQSGKETCINHMLEFDFIASTQEWNDLKRESRKLGLEIAEAILEGMINEMITGRMSII